MFGIKNKKDIKPVKSNLTVLRNYDSHFELFKGRDKKWYFRLVASNGKITAQSEGYVRRLSAISGIESVRKNARFAKTIEV